MAQEQYRDEIDLRTLFQKFGESFDNLMILFYRIIMFLKRNIILLLILIIVGVVLGYFMDSGKGQSKETSMIVQINFNAANYAYNAIDQLNHKLKEGDLEFLEEEGFLVDDSSLILGVKIEPIINIKEIFYEHARGNINFIQTVFDKSKFKDDLLTSEMLLSEYKMHRIFVYTKSDDISSVVDNILKYLNKSELFEKIQKVSVENTINTIEENKLSIAYIDSILKAMGTPNKMALANQVYVSTPLENLHQLVQEKGKLLETTEDLEVELLKYDNTIELINHPQLKSEEGYLSKKAIILPLLFFFIFIALSLLKRLYFKAKRLYHEK